MWIFLGIVAFLALLITAILLLPVNIIIKKDKNGEMQILYKILHKTFGEDPDPNNPVVQIIKKSSGISRIEGTALKQTAKDKGLLTAVTETCRLVFSLLKEVFGLLDFVKVKKLNIDITVTGDDAHETAMNYGLCCAAVYPIMGFVNSKMKAKESVQRINVSSGFSETEGRFDYDIILSVRISRVLKRFIKLAFDEAMRTVKQNQES